ncbi:MAG TPA: 16S rRNA (adenine(1518)-N(6)/adenine(1519)-N(6))-dimethyltransferase [Clostridiales bacterium]|nr:16S rRNA (adenine(1518)-N(6)/adenine(1519)-N(6))-dimethyltransferase [Clostridiales bacterium]
MSDRLHIPRITKDVLKKYNFNLTKGLGQNFLVDGNVIDHIIGAAEITDNDCILEVGPGIGTLTQYLCEKAKKVVSIEIDRQLEEIHHETLPYANLKLIYADFMKVDLTALFNENFKNENVKVVANIPYYITTPIVMRLLEEKLPLDSITVMVQKEVANRFSSPPGSKDYGAITAVIQYYADPKLAFIVPKTVFIPQPKVDSAVIVMELHKEPPVHVVDEAIFFKLVKGAFGQRRKTLVNSVSGTIPDIKKDELLSIITKLGFNPAIRGEKLSINDFALIANELTQSVKSI